MTKQIDLNALNKQLDAEIKNVTELEFNFRKWADQQREKFAEYREKTLNQGDLYLSEYNQIVADLNDIESASKETIDYLINTFQMLCP